MLPMMKNPMVTYNPTSPKLLRGLDEGLNTKIPTPPSQGGAPGLGRDAYVPGGRLKPEGKSGGGWIEPICPAPEQQRPGRSPFDPRLPGEGHFDIDKLLLPTPSERDMGL